MKNSLFIVFILFATAVCLLQCAYQPTYNRFEFVSPTVLCNIDSLEIRGSLSDTIIEMNDTDENPVYLKYSLTNISSKPLTVYWVSKYPVYYLEYLKNNLGLIFGTGNEIVNFLRISEVPKRKYPDSNFATIRPSENLSYKDSINIIDYFNYIYRNDTSLASVGDYWVQLIFKNSIYSHDNKDYWIGTIKTDKLHFEIIE